MVCLFHKYPFNTAFWVFLFLGAVDIFTFSPFNVNWTFRSDPHPPPKRPKRPLEILLLTCTLHIYYSTSLSIEYKYFTVFVLQGRVIQS